MISPTFFSASLSVNVNLVHALCPWYIRISISIWLQAGGQLCIPVTVVSTTHRADMNREDSPLWLYHLCPARLNEARISASAKKTLPGERKMWFLPVTLCLPCYLSLQIHLYSDTHTFLFSLTHPLTQPALVGEGSHVYFLGPGATVQCHLLYCF